jgi:hypothetical protein
VPVADPIPRVERLAEAGPSRRTAALATLAMGVLLGAAEILLPGQPFGVAAASLAAYVQIQRWESENGRRVVYDPEAGEPRPYAGPPL